MYSLSKYSLSKYFLLALLCLLLGSGALAQSTTVSGQVTDSGAQAWNNGTFTFQFIPNNNFPSSTYSWTGGVLTQTITGSLNATGGYSQSVPSNTSITPSLSQWRLQVCSGTVPVNCFSVTQTITGGSQTVNVTPPAIIVPPGAGNTAYVTSEVSPAVVGSQIYIIGTGFQLCSAVSGGVCTTWSSSSSSSSSGPVINVTNTTYAGCPAATGADWITCFTSASAALDAASLVGTPTVRVSSVQACSVSCTSLPITFTVQTGDTILLWLTGAGTADTVTVTDNGGNPYRIIYPLISNAGTSLTLWGTGPRGAVGATTITVADGTTRVLSATIAAVSNYGSDRELVTFNANSTTAPTVTDVLTQDTNNLFLTGINWTGTSITATANSGTLLQNVTATTTVFGQGLVSNAVGALGSATNSITLSGASPALAIAVEVRSHSEMMPTLYVPQGDYNYSGGLSLLHPAILKGEGGGSRLCYLGSNHAVDIAPISLTVNNYMRTFIVDGVSLTCGAKMSAGIWINPFATFVGIRNSNFTNFGNPTAYMISATNDDDDIEIGPQNRFITDDGIPRNVAIVNTTHVSNASYLRIHDNLIVCWFLSTASPTTCTAAQAGIGFVIDGAQSRVYHNNLAFFNPDILVKCTSGAQPCFGNEIAYNQMEPVQGVGLPVIQFQNNQVGLLAHENVINMQNAASPIGPADGAATLQGARVNFNTIVSTPATTPVVALNNLAGQTFNQSSNNLCGVAYVLGTCPIPHTIGANITQWSFNTDDGLTATGAAVTLTGTGACATITTQSGSWAGQATCTGTTGASTFIITPGSTAPHGWQCDASDVTTANALRQSATSTTACTISGTVNANDVLTFKAVAY